MNKCIGQLAEQAGLLGPSSRVGNSHEATEKFARLIVKEMCDLFDNRAKPGTRFYDPHEPAELIKQHFGVEE
jgi:hypothetical protein